MKSWGFSYIELIITLAVIGIIVAISSPSLAGFYLSNNFDVGSAILVSSLKKAQQYAVTNKNGLSWGVCLIGRNLRLYGGNCLIPTIKDDYFLPSSVNIFGLSDISFSPFRGEPPASVSITISSASKNTTVVINDLGGIHVQ